MRLTATLVFMVFLAGALKGFASDSCSSSLTDRPDSNMVLLPRENSNPYKGLSSESIFINNGVIYKPVSVLNGDIILAYPLRGTYTLKPFELDDVYKGLQQLSGEPLKKNDAVELNMDGKLTFNARVVEVKGFMVSVYFYTYEPKVGGPVRLEYHFEDLPISRVHKIHF